VAGRDHIEPPQGLRAQRPLRLEGDWSAEDLRDPRPRLLRPDAIVETARKDGVAESRALLIEFDRTGRVDKDLEKFRRYDAFLTWRWRHTEYGDMGEAPFVIFVCQNEAQHDRFVVAADRELTGDHWHPSAPSEGHSYLGRGHIVFAVESDLHAGDARAVRVAPYPEHHARRGPQQCPVRSSFLEALRLRLLRAGGRQRARDPGPQPARSRQRGKRWRESAPRRAREERRLPVLLRAQKQERACSLVALLRPRESG
jgi:hypothetical protein